MKRNPIKKKSNSERARLTRDLDNLVKKLIKLRDNYTCQYCGKPAKPRGLHAAHIYDKGRWPQLRFDTLNVIALCYHCHIRGFHSGNFPAIQAWVAEKWPERIAYLEKMKDSPKITLDEMRTAVVKLSKKLVEKP